MANRITITIDRGGLIKRTHGDVFAISGYHPDELKGENVNLLVPGELKEKHDKGHERYRATGIKTVMGSWLTVPLLKKGGEQVMVQLCITERDGFVTALITGDLRDEVDPGEMLDAAEKSKAMERELEFAKEIQHSMLPLTFPKLSDTTSISISASIKSAKDVGGDFYDFGQIDADHYYIGIGDVSCKGVPAALFMAVVKTLLQGQLYARVEVGKALTKVNQELSASNKSMMFSTVWIAIININTGNMSYSNAGHNPPFLLDGEGITKIKELHGPPLGVIDDHVYTASQISLRPLDSLYLYTDGVTEAMDTGNKEYGEERLTKWLERHSNLQPKAGVTSLMDDVAKFAGNAAQSDDITILGMSFYGPPRLDLKLPAKISSIPVVLSAMEDLFEDEESQNIVKTALDDILNNIITHSGSPYFRVEAGTILNEIWIRTSDAGTPFDPTSADAPTDLDKPLEERAIGGLGLHLVKQMVGRIRYFRDNDKNILIISKATKNEH